MAAIDLTEEILSHTDDEIIAYLSGEMAGVKRIYARATKEKTPELFYMAATTLDNVYNILAALNRRNQEKSL